MARQYSFPLNSKVTIEEGRIVIEVDATEIAGNLEFDYEVVRTPEELEQDRERIQDVLSASPFNWSPTIELTS